MSSIINLLFSSIKKRWLLIHFILLSFTAAAQNSAVSGTILDTAQQPVAFADVVLRSVRDSTAVKTSFTDENGHFEIKNIQPGDYTITISTIGFDNHIQQLSVTGDLKLPDVIMKAGTKELDNVVINQKRPVVKRKIDRLEFDVENSILSSDNAWEIIKKTPGVDVSGGLSIRGSSGILVTINDRKVYLTGTELKNLLENTSGEDIKLIEVITTPPAKYEAQGSAVLNIKMKKNVSIGYRGGLSGAYVQSMYPKGVISTNHYYKDNRFAVYGGYMFGSGHYYGESNSTVKYFNPDSSVASEWKSKEKSNFRALQQNSYNLTAEYTIDTLNTVTVGANGFSSLKSTANIHNPTYIYNGSGQLDSLYNSRNHRDYPQKNLTVNGSYEHKFNAGHKITVASDITQYYFNQDQQITADFSLPDESPYRQNVISSDDTRRINLFSAQADYTGQAWDSNIEAGFRYGSVDADNDFNYLDITTGDPDPNLDMTNRFLYNENILAGYVSMDKEIGKWGLKAGLRGEHTRLEGNSLGTAEVNTQNYFKLFPTVYALYKASDNHQIGASYGKRIVRPQYSALNPFKSYNTPYSYSAGDPRLQPAITHNFNVQYTLYNKYNFDLYYRYEKDPAMDVAYQDYATNTLVRQITNIDKNTAFGLDFNTNLEIFPWWQFGVQASGVYLENTFQGVDGNLYVNKKAAFNGDTNNRFTLNKKKDFFGELNFGYGSPRAIGTFTISGISTMSVSFKKQFFQNRAELALVFSDIYRGEKQTFTTQYANQYASSKDYNDSQSFRVQFRYRFGNQKLAGAKERQTTEEQNRL